METLIGRKVIVSTTCANGYDCDNVREVTGTITALGKTTYGDQYYKVSVPDGPNQATSSIKNLSFRGGILRMA